MPTLIVVIYDGINNSVFQSQVVAPLLSRKADKPQLTIHIISFEKNSRIKPPSIPGITFHIFKRYPFLHRLSLWLTIIRLGLFLQQFNAYELLARGPFAGYIAYKAATKNCNHITVQARGLVAEEYRYTLGAKELNLLERHRYAQFLNLEKRVYGINTSSVIFQAVSPALKEYMVATFATNPASITVAHEDIPKPISSEQKERFRKAVRAELNIEDDARVYCYSGSYKPWQCPQETIAYFKNEYQLNPKAILLILSLDKELFESALRNATLPQEAYRMRSVPAGTLLIYLAAADIGLLLREEHIINFVSRPTKALEYHAAGLTVVHNDTVDYVKNLAEVNSSPRGLKAYFLVN